MPSNESWNDFPLRLGAYSFALSEVLSPLSTAAATYGVPTSASRLIFPLRLLCMGYVGASSMSTGYAAGGRELHPDRVRAAQRRATADALISGWIECITLPGIFIGAIMGGLVKTGQAQVVAGGPPTNRLPFAIGMVLVPAVLPVSKQLTEAVMDWAFRPTLNYLSQPSSFLVAANPTDYVPPSVDALLSPSDLTSSESKNEILESLMLPPDLDPLSRARFEWAADGDIGSMYPIESDADAALETGNVGGSIRGGLSSTSTKKVTPLSTSAKDIDYVEAVKRIRERAETRRS